MALAANMDGEISAKSERRMPGISDLWRSWLWTLAGMTGAGRSPVRRRHVRIWASDDGISLATATARRYRALGLDFATMLEATDWAEIHKALRRRGVARRPIVVRLAGDQVLVKTIRLPAAVGDVMEPVLRNQMQRLTPWPDGEVVFGYGVLPSTPASSHIDVEVVAAHRPMIETVKATVAEAGLTLVRIEHAASPEAGPGIALFDIGIQNQQRAARRVGRLLTLMAALGFSIGAVGLFDFARNYQASVDLEHQIGLAEQRIANHARLATQRHARSDSYRMLMAQKVRQAPAIWVLDELTKSIPKHSWLSDLSLSDGRITITGSSTNAAELISALDRTKAFNDVRFTAATTRDRTSGRERFVISANVVFSEGLAAQR